MVPGRGAARSGLRRGRLTEGAATMVVVLSALGLTALTVVIHGLGTVASAGRALRRWDDRPGGRGRLAAELLMAGLVSALLTVHLAEAVVWALFLVGVGALPDLESAVYFSLTSYTTVGYGDVVLPGSWRLLGPIEAAVGVLMMGWSTGVVVAVIGMLYRRLFRSLAAGSGGSAGG